MFGCWDSRARSMPRETRGQTGYIYISYISYYTWRERPTFFSPWLPQSLLPGLTRSSNPPGDNRAKYCGDQRIVKRLEHFKKAAIPKMPASYGRILMINAPCFFCFVHSSAATNSSCVYGRYIDSENRAYRAYPPVGSLLLIFKGKLMISHQNHQMLGCPILR